MAKQKLLVIAGPTAVGKTKLGIECAKLFNGEIISADCMQVYKKLDIGTAKASPDEQAQAVHHMIDFVDPKENYDVAQFKEQATNLIKDISSRGKLPIVVGGTGMYIESLLYPFEFCNSEKNEQIRSGYKKLLEKKGNQYVYDLLVKIDPKTAQKLHPNDTKRVIRALEIYDTTGIPKSEQVQEKISDYDYKLLFLNADREVLYDRINKRVDIMLNDGLENEVKSLVAEEITRDNQCFQGIGYREFFDYFDNKISYDELVNKIKQDSRNYAKRQITWFRHMKNAEEVDIKNLDDIIKSVEIWLKTNN